MKQFQTSSLIPYTNSALAAIQMRSKNNFNSLNSLKRLDSPEAMRSQSSSIEVRFDH